MSPAPLRVLGREVPFYRLLHDVTQWRRDFDVAILVVTHDPSVRLPWHWQLDVGGVHAAVAGDVLEEGTALEHAEEALRARGVREPAS